MTPLSLNVNFREKQPADMELFAWAIEQLGPGDNPGNRSRLGREAFRCLRLFGSLEQAQRVQRYADAARRYIAGEITQDELEEISK